jgi:Phosphotransferase enzyme family
VFKYAREPFDLEHLALALAHRHGVPVPRLLAARTAPGVLGMLLEDLGHPVRDADQHDAARAAARLHRVPADDAGRLPRLDQAALAGLPAQIAARAARLSLPGIAATAAAIARHSGRLAEGTELPPFGFCHSEFHPTSLHIGTSGWRLLDLARAFTGPALLLAATLFAHGPAAFDVDVPAGLGGDRLLAVTVRLDGCRGGPAR